MANSTVVYDGFDQFAGYKIRIVKSDLHGKPIGPMLTGAKKLLTAVADWVQSETKFRLRKISSFYFADGSGFLNFSMSFVEYESFMLSFLESWLETHGLKPTLVRGEASTMSIAEVYLYNEKTLQLKIYYEHMY